jgi:hypothetical protein
VNQSNPTGAGSPPDRMTPQQTLTAAATKVRETSQGVSHYPTPWYAEPSDDECDQWQVLYPTDNPLAGLIATTPDYGRVWLADWIALMSPAVAEPLAAWLEGCASEASSMTDPDDWSICDEPSSVRSALAVARAVLGGAA